MRIRSIAILIFAGALLMFSAIAAACGSSGGDGDVLTLEDYMAELDTLDDQFEERSNELDTQFEEAFADAGSDVDAAIQIFVEFFDNGKQAVSDFVDGIDALKPPPEAEAVHKQAVTAGRNTIEALNDLIAELQGVTSEADFGAAIDSSGMETASDAFTQACEDIQALADENSIEVTFSCG